MNTGNVKPKSLKANSEKKKTTTVNSISLDRDREDIPHIELPPMGFKEALTLMADVMVKYELNYVRCQELEIRKDVFKPKELPPEGVRPMTPEEIEKEANRDLYWSAE